MFIYYVPSPKGSVNLEYLRSRGLGYAFDATPSITSASVGPLGSDRGVFAANSRTIKSPDVNLENYDWRKLHFTNALVGLHKTNRHGPKELLREEVIQGRFLELGDGNRWHIPVARRFDEPSMSFVQAVPAVLDVDENGNWTDGGRTKEHEALWEGAIKFYDEFVNALPGENDDDEDRGGVYLQSEFFDDAARAIQANYLVGKVEVAMLGLLTTSLAGEVMRIVSGCAGFIEYAQKKSEDSASSSLNVGGEG